MDSIESVAQRDGPLAGLRVLECGAGIASGYAGRLLADLGAAVIKVETSPFGDPLRRRPVPAAAGEAPVSGGLFTALNHGKLALEVDLGSEPGRAEFGRLVRGSDAAVLSAPVPEALDVDRLRAMNPKLVVGVASSCRLMGLDAGALHLHAAAMSSVSSVVGHADRAPLPPPFDVGEYETGVNLAAAILAACHRAERCGVGQLVQVDTAELLFSYMWGAGAISQQSAEPFVRSGRRFPGSGGAYPFAVFGCRDGHVAAIGRSLQDWQALLQMMGDPSWADDDRFNDPVEIARHHADAADEHVIPWFAARTCAEVFGLARQHQFPIAPLNRMLDVLELDQFLARQAFGPPIDIGGVGVRFLRRPYQFSDTRLRECSAWTGSATGPVVESVNWPARRVERAPNATKKSRSIFEGLRVLDLGWVWSGPMISAVLADLGADVIKVEHRGRLDNARLRGRPLVNGVPLEGDPRELSLSFHQHNRGKRSFTLDIKDARGAQLLKELARHSDIVVENLSPGVFDRAEVGYRDLAAVNPRIIWLAASSAGQRGPLAGMRAYAPIMTAIAGLEALVGYEDDAVVGMLGCGLGDPNAGSHGLLAVLAALRAREATGRGQYIDMSQIEAAVAVLVEPLVNAQLRGRQPEPWGFAHPAFAPHGHFRCKGDDNWVAIAAADDAMWQRLAQAVGGSLSADRWKHADLDARQCFRTEIHAAIEEWTKVRPRDDALDTLRAADVAVAPVLCLSEAMEVFDRLLARVAHPVTGEERIAPIAWDFSETPARIARPAPLVGQHTELILRELLGYADLDVDSLLQSSATL